MGDLNQFQVEQITKTFYALVLLFSFLLRIIISWAHAKEYDLYKGTYRLHLDFAAKSQSQRFWIKFKGFSQEDPSPDMWYNFILGTIELFVYPILMVRCSKKKLLRYRRPL
jgi:hypothetical protein